MNFTGKKLCKPAALAALLVSLTLASPAWLSAATYSVGEGGDYSSLNDIISSGIIAQGDEIVLLSNDYSLSGDVSVPSGVTIRGSNDNTVVTAGRINGDVVFENIRFSASPEKNFYLAGNISGSSNLIFENFSSQFAEFNFETWSNLSNVTFKGNSVNMNFLIISNSEGIHFSGNSGTMLAVGFDNVNNLIVENHQGGNYFLQGVDGSASFKNLTNARFSGNGSLIFDQIVRFTGGSNILFENNTGTVIDASIYSAGRLYLTEVGSITFKNNTGLSIDADNVNFQTSNVDFIGNSRMSNSSSVYGGAMSVLLNTDISEGTYRFLGNQAVAGYNVATGEFGKAGGGAIYGALITMNGGSYVFESNTAIGQEARGGAIFSDNRVWGTGHPNDSYVKIDNGTFNNNHAIGYANGGTGGYGGAIASNLVEMSNSSLAGNTASGYGGAIYAYSQPVLNDRTGHYVNYNRHSSIIHNTSITGNSAGVAGGGIYTNNHLTLSADAGKSTIISGNTARGMSDGIYIDTNTIYYTEEGQQLTNDNKNVGFTVSGAGTVRIDDTVRAEGDKAVDFNKNGSSSLIWGERNYFTNNSNFNFNEGNTTLSNNFSLQAENMSLSLAAGHSLYLELTGRDRDLALFSGLNQLTVGQGSALLLSFNGISIPTLALDLGSWLFADLNSASAGLLDQLNNFEMTILVNGIMYYGAFFEIIDTGVWLNMASLSTTPVPASILLLGTGVAALIRMRRRAA